jgi:hypothetical protein
MVLTEIKQLLKKHRQNIVILFVNQRTRRRDI